MKKYMYPIVAFFYLIFISSCAAYAAERDDNIPAVIVAGLKEYKTGGAESAIKAWVKGSSMEKNIDDALSQANSFKKIEEFYGNYLAYHLIDIVNITETSRIVSISMNFEKGPVFARFLAYKTDKDWILVNFDFNTKPEIILPGLLLK